MGFNFWASLGIAGALTHVASALPTKTPWEIFIWGETHLNIAGFLAYSAYLLFKKED